MRPLALVVAFWACTLLAAPAAAHPPDRARAQLSVGATIPRASTAPDMLDVDFGGVLAFDLVYVMPFDPPWGQPRWAGMLGGRARALHNSTDTIGSLELVGGFTMFHGDESGGVLPPLLEVSLSLGFGGGEVRGDNPPAADFGLSAGFRTSVGFRVSSYASISLVYDLSFYFSSERDDRWFPATVSLSYAGVWR